MESVNLNINRLWKTQKFDKETPSINPDPPKTLEGFHKRFMGDPKWSGEIRVWVMDRDGYLVLHSDDLDLIPWKDLPNVQLMDAAYDQDTFSQYLASAKNSVSKKRGHMTMTLYPMMSCQWRDIALFTEDTEA